MNAKTITAAVLAVLIAVSLGMVVASEPSEAAPSDAESIDETMEFTALETYELDGRSLVFTEGGRLVFQEASVLSVNGRQNSEANLAISSSQKYAGNKLSCGRKIYVRLTSGTFVCRRFSTIRYSMPLPFLPLPADKTRKKSFGN